MPAMADGVWSLVDRPRGLSLAGESAYLRQARRPVQHRRQERRRYQLVLVASEQCRNSRDGPGGLSHSTGGGWSLGHVEFIIALWAAVLINEQTPRSEERRVGKE